MTEFDDQDAPTKAVTMLAGIAAVASEMGFDERKIIDDLKGNSELSKFCRALLDLQSVAIPTKGPGRPADAQKRQHLYHAIRTSLEKGMTVDEAVGDYADRYKLKHESVMRQYRRVRANISLADLYGYSLQD